MEAESPPRVLFEDGRVLVLDKPSGRVVVPGRGGTGTPLVEEVSRRLGAKAYVVHRLDRGTSGVLLFAKTAQAHRECCAAFEARSTRKVYLALVHGNVDQDGVVDRPIREFGSGRMGCDARGKPSQTAFRVLERFPDSSLLEVEPRTGRRHQIRVHLFSVGHPVIGDDLYGNASGSSHKAPRLMLHAWRLELPGRTGERPLSFCCPLPPDFESFLSSLRAQ